MVERMSLYHFISRLAFSCILCLLLGYGNASTRSEQVQTYIVHMDHSHKPASFPTHQSWHRSVLRSLSNVVDDEEVFLYSYSHAMHGFSARLTISQLAELEKSPAHVGTYCESFGKLFTTYSPKFLGLSPHRGLLPDASYGEGVIIGIIDTGVWPESESFSDKGMPPVPRRWKGECENGTAFSPSLCNRKLIGARSFSKGLRAAGRNISSEYDYDSARDFLGHGTHTSSTAAGNYALGVSHFGYAKGTARGVAPRAHVAMYKVLFATDTEESAASDVLAGMDQAIADGVDVMSLSLGFDQSPYFHDVIAIASLSATEKGVVVVCATGNDGDRNTTHNAAPWITTVGAGTLDRSFTANMTLANDLTFEGISYFPASVYIHDIPLYYGKGDANKAICFFSSLNQTEVKGKIVLCDNSTKTDAYEQRNELVRAGAYGGILLSDILEFELNSEGFTIPSLILPTASGTLIRAYAIGTSTPKVKSMNFIQTKIGTTPSPQVAFFSSRGPDPINPSILKPDIIAPGYDVLAAFLPTRPFCEIGEYELTTSYALLSGTSMAAPHVAGVVALLKHVHPEWSPAAIRSALMTTAYIKDNTGSVLKDQSTSLPATPLDFGAGHINPNRAMDPGLVYDMNIQDYIDFLCGLGYNEKQMSAVLRRNQWNCNHRNTDLNYPSFTFLFTSETASPSMKNFSRVVTNVGDDASVYKATLEVPSGMRVSVKPRTLSFAKQYQKQSFVVSMEIDKDAPLLNYGYLKWIDQHGHVVSSPLVAFK